MKALGAESFLRSHGSTELLSAAAGVMSLDFHPQQANILALGLYSGNIEVHNVRAEDSSHMLYKTSAATGKHLGAVTAIRWTADCLPCQIGGQVSHLITQVDRAVLLCVISSAYRGHGFAAQLPPHARHCARQTIRGTCLATERGDALSMTTASA